MRLEPAKVEDIPNRMGTFQIITLSIYFLVLGILALYGLHRYLMVYLYYKYKNNKPEPASTFYRLPHVTVQLPIYNEMYVADRLITSVSKIEYPKESLEIQVLDDSTDETVLIAQGCERDLRKQGFDIKYMHRGNREGFKAGALEEGLKKAKGDFILIFDADFISTPEILRKTIHYFTDEKVGMVQVRWDHINRNYSLLTQLQSIFLDGHFVIEHGARNRSGRFFNFNGTAGIWRKKCIIDAGGWEHDTLTEDLDLSYRAQLRGWKFIFLPEMNNPAEVPVEINSFKSQQHRWAKGSIQTAKKLLPRVLASKIPWTIKLEAAFHLTGNVSYLLMVIFSLMLLPAILIRAQLGIRSIVTFSDIPFLMAATASVSLFYSCSQREILTNWVRQIKYFPMLLSLGIGLSANNAKAVLEALFNHQTDFQRTPKFRIEKKDDNWKVKKYRSKRNFVPYVELFLGLYTTVSLYFAIQARFYLPIPFLLLFLVGFFYIAGLSLWQSRQRV